MSVRCALDDCGRALFGLAGTLTDDAGLAERLVTQAVLRAGNDSSSPEWLGTVRVWAVRALLSTDHTLGQPVAADVDVPLAQTRRDDCLAARLAASSPLQRAVTALHYGQHLDAADVARVVGSSEADIEAYLRGVRSRLGITTEADALALRRLLRERADAAAASAAGPLARLRELLPRTPEEQVDADAAREAESARRAADETAAAEHAELAEVREHRARLEIELDMTRTAFAERTAELTLLRTELDEIRAEHTETGTQRSPDDRDHTDDTDDTDDTDPTEDTEDSSGPHAAQLPLPVATEGAAMVRPDAHRPYPSPTIVRLLVVLTGVLGVSYLSWRWAFSVHWSAWWIAAPLVLAETYSLTDALLFGFTVWRQRRHSDPGPPPDGATADVFVTTCAEPLDVVMTTARAAQAMTFAHTVWILDDADRSALRNRAAREGIGYVSRADASGPVGRASDDTVNRALQRTRGEFVALLDAGQVPAPELLDRTLGYFRDAGTAVVQTPPATGAPGSAATVLDRSVPIGGDGWGCAFFAGSNAVLRRTALLQAGICRPVHEFPVAVDDALTVAERVIRQARNTVRADRPVVSEALLAALHACRDLRAELAHDVPLASAAARFRTRVHAAARVVERSLGGTAAELASMFDDVDEQLAGVTATEHQHEALEQLVHRDWSPLGALEAVSALVAAVEVDTASSSTLPVSSRSVAGDLAAALRMQRLGWRSVHHDEVLAVATAPADLASTLEQGLRRAQGTIVATLRDRPLARRGLALPHRLVYFGAAWTYLSGFAALAYVAAPVVYLASGVLPVHTLDGRLFARLLPLLVVEQLLVLVVGSGPSAGRGRPHSLALFPVSIRAVVSAVGAVSLGREPAVRTRRPTPAWRLLLPQLAAVALLVAAAGLGLARLAAGEATALGTGVTLLWVAIVLVQFGPVLRALHRHGRAPLDASGSYAAGMAPSRGSTGTSTGTVSG